MSADMASRGRGYFWKVLIAQPTEVLTLMSCLVGAGRGDRVGR